MPLFFREKHETSIKAADEELKNEQLPAIVQPTDPGEDIQSNREHANLPDSVEQIPTESDIDSPEVVPSRKTKPFNKVLAGSVVLLVVPMMLLLFRIGTDEFTRDFVCARIHWIVKDDGGAVTYLSKALQEKQDRRALEVRADCYNKLGDIENERADLRTLIQSTDLSKLPQFLRNGFVYNHYQRLATIEASLGDLKEAERLYQLSANPSSSENSSSYNTADVSYNLLLLDDISKAKALLAQANAEKTDTFGQVFGQALGAGDASRKLLQALIYREEGDQALAMNAIQSIGDKYVWAFRDSRLRYSAKNEVVPWSLEALIYLDQGNPSKARPLIQQAQEELSLKDKSAPILDVLKAWLLLEEGRLDDCLKLSKETLANQNDLNKTIEGLNLKASLHLLRKIVFLKQNLPSQAAQEDQLYKQCHVSGRLFTPVCFRPKL